MGSAHDKWAKGFGWVVVPQKITPDASFGVENMTYDLAIVLKSIGKAGRVVRMASEWPRSGGRSGKGGQGW